MTRAIPWSRSHRCGRGGFVVARRLPESRRLQTTDSTARQECRAGADRDDNLERPYPIVILVRRS